jgi:hypothetical protein
MFKKIHSNRDPQDTVFSELRKEFRPYYESAGKRFNRMLKCFPRFWFGLMIVLLVFSLILSFIVCRRPTAKVQVVKASINPVTIGFGQIMAANAALQKTIMLKKRVDSLLHLKSLSRADSLELSGDIDSLSAIRQTIK